MKILIAAIFALTIMSVNAGQISCTGMLQNVGFLPQYAGKVISIDTDYRTSIWAKTVDAEKTDLVMSILLAAFMADRSVTIQWNAPTATTCSEIDRYTGAVLIDRVWINK